MKKILFITYSFSLGGGSEKILSNILNGLADKTDYDVSVLEYAKYDIKSERINSKIKSLNPIVDMNKSSKAERILKLLCVHFCPWLLRALYIKEKYDVEIAFNYQIPSFLTSARKDVYNIQWNHGAIYDLKDGWFKRFLQGLSYKKANKIVTISKVTEESVLEIFPQYKEKACLIYNGTDIDSINNGANQNTDITLKENSLVFLGRLEDNKNPLKLLEYMERLIAEGVDVNLYMLGTGVQQEEVAERIKSAGLEERIVLLGYINNPYPIIKQSRAVCMLSKSEGFPTVFTEGMALGKPFISSNVGGVRELSNDGKCGVVVDGYEEFKQAVKSIVLDLQNNETMSCACKEHIRLFSYDEQIKKIIGLIEQK